MKLPTNPDHRFNYDDVFFRDLTACLLDTIDGQLTWVNRFSSGDVQVRVPIFYSMTGDESFLLDSFSDDIVSNSRYVEVNTSMIPRGHMTLTSYSIKGDEFANPNVWLKWVREDNDEIRKILTKVRAVPLSVKFDLQIMVKSEIDAFKCQEAIINMFWLYKYMFFEHNFMNIDAVFVVPDDSNVEIQREQNLAAENVIKLTTSFEVHTYYPAVRPQNYDYKKGRIGGAGQDGIVSDDATNMPGLFGGDMMIPKRVKWRTHTNRVAGYGEVEAAYLENTFAIDKNSEVIAIIENINNNTFEVARTYKLKDTLSITELLRPANQYEIDNFVLSFNSNFSPLNVTYTSVSPTLKGLTLSVTHYPAGATISQPIDYLTTLSSTVSFWSISSYSILDYYNQSLGITVSNANLRISNDDSSYTDYIGGNNIYNQQFLIQYGINKV